MAKLFAAFLPWIKVHWIALVLAVLVLALVFFLGWLIWRRYGESIKGAVVAWWRNITRKPDISSDALLRIWHHFQRNIPLSIRAKVRTYPVFLVIGDDRCGKSTLISNSAHLDVQGFRYHPSLDHDALMQVYLGNECIVIELSASFLYATKPDYANALLALWKKLPIETRVVMAVDAYSMITGPSEIQSKIIDTLIGKLALFQEISELPVPFMFVLTHMDRLRGFSEFNSFAGEIGLDFRVSVNNDGSFPCFSSGLDEYFTYLNNGLVKLASHDFLRIIKFLQDSGTMLDLLNKYVSLSCEKSSLSKINLERICLVSPEGQYVQHGLRANNPFESNDEIKPPYAGLSVKNLKRVGYLGCLALFLQFEGYYSERHALTKGAEYVSNIPAMSPDKYVNDAHPLFDELFGGHHSFRWNPLWFLHRRFFESQRSELEIALAQSLRTYYLLPRLELIQQQDSPYRKTIRMLALLHANSKNELSRYFSVPHPGDGIQLPFGVISDYISVNNNLNDPQLLQLEQVDYGTFVRMDSNMRPWEMLVNRITQVMKQKYIVATDLEELQSGARNLQTISEHIRGFPDLDAEILWLERNGHVSSLTKAEWSSSPSDAQLSSSQFLDSLRLITSSSIQINNIPSNISRCLEEIQGMNADHKKRLESNKLGVVSIHLGDHVYSLDTNEWLNLIHRTQVKALLESFYRRQYSNSGWIFFEPQDHPQRIQLGISSDDTGVLVNNSQVDIRLTKDYFDQFIKPSINIMASTLPDLPIDQSDKQRLVDFFVQNLSIYAGRYSDAYWNFFHNMAIRISTPEQLSLYLAEIQRPGAAFVQNLVAIRDNVLLDLPPGPNFQPVRDRLEDFRFLKKLMEEQAGSFPQLQRYIAIVSEMNDAILKDLPLQSASEKSGTSPGIKTILPPLGKVSYDILLGLEGSYLRKTETFLRDLNIPNNWQTPFLTPVYRARDFGRIDINKAISSGWRQLFDKQVQPLLSFFPIDSSRTGPGTDLNVDNLTAVFHPVNGTFWMEVRNVYSGLFNVLDNKWTVKPEVASVFVLPEDMENRINNSAVLTQMLWGKDGGNQSLVFKVRADLMPEIRVTSNDGNDIPLTSLTFLRSGTSSVLGFNQRKMWQDFSWEWWQKGVSTAGVEFMNPAEKIKKYASVDVDDTRWSLFRLLMQAERVGSNQFGWTVTQPDIPERKLKVTFVFKNDPFAIFSALRSR